MAKRLPITIAIPDTGVLISLAHGDLLDLLFAFADDVRIEITDVVEFESTRKTELFDAKRISTFLEKHKSRITVKETSFKKLLVPGADLPENLGEVSIYGYVNQIRNSEGPTPTLILFEDKWFKDNQYSRPRNTHLVSLKAFLLHLETLIPGFTYQRAVDEIRRTRPTASQIKEDIAADSGTVWKPKVRRPR